MTDSIKTLRMSAHTKLSPAKAERVKALAENLAEAAARYAAVASKVPDGWPDEVALWKEMPVARAARDAARAALIAECEAPEAT